MLFLLVWLSAVGLSAQTGFMGHSSGGYCKLGGPCDMTAPILLSAGTVSAPGLAFVVDTDMGMWRVGGTSLVIQNQGTGVPLGRSYFTLATESWAIASYEGADAAKYVITGATDTGGGVMEGYRTVYSAATTYAELSQQAQSLNWNFNTAGGGEKDIFQLGTGGITLCDQADDTKCINNVFSGITTATTRSVSWPDDAGVVAVETATDDMVLTADGTRWVGKAMPTTGTNGCADATDDKLLYNTSTNTWSCGTDQTGGAAFDPSTTVQLIEEFMTGHNTAGHAGQLGHYPTLLASGTNGQVTGTTTHPGVWKLSSHVSNDDSGAILAFNSASASSSETDDWETTDWALDAVIEIASAGAITNSAFLFGLTTSAGALYHTNMVFIRRDTDLTDTTWAFEVCDTSACETTDDAANVQVELSTITPSAATWYRLRIRHAVSGVGSNPTIYFRINDETEVTFCSSGCDDTLEQYEGVTMVPFVAYVTRTTSEVKSSLVDYFAVNFTGLTRY
jgi:hypothetical protein